MYWWADQRIAITYAKSQLIEAFEEKIQWAWGRKMYLKYENVPLLIGPAGTIDSDAASVTIVQLERLWLAH